MLGSKLAAGTATDIPATVVGVLVTDKTYPDPNYGTNLKNFPGMYISEKTVFRECGYAGGQSFCLFVVVSHGIYELPADGAGKTDWLHFNGINYRANIWLNGQKVADAKEVAGTYRHVRIQRYEIFETWGAQCAGGGSFRARERRSGDYLGGLESHAT